MMGRKWIFEDYFYVYKKKHFCKYCNNELIVKRIKKTINSKSPEAENFDFSFSGGDGGFLFGDVVFSFEVFYCPNCDIEISVDEIRKYEIEQKRFNKYKER